MTDLLRGYGHDPHFVEGDDPLVVHQSLAATLDTVLAKIRKIQREARSGDASRGITVVQAVAMLASRNRRGSEIDETGWLASLSWQIRRDDRP